MHPTNKQNDKMKTTHFTISKVTTEKKPFCTFVEKKVFFKLDEKMLFALLFIVPAIVAGLLEILKN